MIASHNTFTYLRPCQWWARLFPWMWRTQDQNISCQYFDGVRYFDIRVRRDNDKWRVCHGLVDFPLTFDSLPEILNRYSAVICRVILERGDKRRFIDETDLMLQGTPPPNLHAIIIKKNWEILYQAQAVRHPLTSEILSAPKIVDNTYRPWDSGKRFIENIIAFRPNTIRHWAKHHPAPDNAANDNTTIYFQDFV